MLDKIVGYIEKHINFKYCGFILVFIGIVKMLNDTQSIVLFLILFGLYLVLEGYRVEMINEVYDARKEINHEIYEAGKEIRNERRESEKEINNKIYEVEKEVREERYEAEDEIRNEIKEKIDEVRKEII